MALPVSEETFSSAITGWFGVLKDSSEITQLVFIVGVVLCFLILALTFIKYTKIKESKKSDLETSYTSAQQMTLRAIQHITEEQQRVFEIIMDNQNKADARHEKFYNTLADAIRDSKEQSTRDSNRLEMAVRDVNVTIDSLNNNFLSRPCGVAYQSR